MQKNNNHNAIINTLIILSRRTLCLALIYRAITQLTLTISPCHPPPPKRKTSDRGTNLLPPSPPLPRLLLRSLKLWDVSPLPPPLAPLPPPAAAVAAAAAPPGAAAALRGRHDPAGGGLLKAPHPLLHPSAPPGCSANHGHALATPPHPYSSSPKNT